MSWGFRWTVNNWGSAPMYLRINNTSGWCGGNYRSPKQKCIFYSMQMSIITYGIGLETTNELQRVSGNEEFLDTHNSYLIILESGVWNCTQVHVLQLTSMNRSCNWMTLRLISRSTRTAVNELILVCAYEFSLKVKHV